MPENWVQHPVVNTEAGSNPGAPLAWGSPENPDDAVAGYGYVPCDTSEVEETFYYHSDHLGSTSYITDQQANVTQYDAYLPYGELLVDEHSSSADLPYKFNGKELDEETGLYYYGARYMSPVTSMWYGVDKSRDCYPRLSSYCFCESNPIRVMDPNGRDIVLFGKNKSSVTIQTDLINVKVNVSCLGFDFHGNHSLNGEEILSAALDLVGIVDPSGIADGLNASLQLKNGDYWGCAISACGFIPYIGDAPKLALKGKKDYRILITAIQKHHVIPKAVYRKYSKELSKIILRDSGKNLKKLPNRFHGNHPNYSKWIELQLNKISKKNNGTINAQDIDMLLDKARKKINEAYDNFQQTGGKENMDKYFKKIIESER